MDIGADIPRRAEQGRGEHHRAGGCGRQWWRGCSESTGTPRLAELPELELNSRCTLDLPKQVGKRLLVHPILAKAGPGNPRCEFVVVQRLRPRDPDHSQRQSTGRCRCNYMAKTQKGRQTVPGASLRFVSHWPVLETACFKFQWRFTCLSPTPGCPDLRRGRQPAMYIDHLRASRLG